MCERTVAVLLIKATICQEIRVMNCSGWDPVLCSREGLNLDSILKTERKVMFCDYYCAVMQAKRSNTSINSCGEFCLVERVVVAKDASNLDSKA